MRHLAQLVRLVDIQQANWILSTRKLHGRETSPCEQGGVGRSWLDYCKDECRCWGWKKANMVVIVSVLGPGTYASRVCYDLSLGGYHDCYLPFRDE